LIKNFEKFLYDQDFVSCKITGLTVKPLLSLRTRHVTNVEILRFARTEINIFQGKNRVINMSQINNGEEQESPEEMSVAEIVKNNLMEPNFEIGQEYAEMALDHFMDEGIWKDAPLIGTGVRAVKTLLAVKEAFERKKISSFLKQFHSGNLPEEKMVEFRIRLEDEPTFRADVLEQVMVMNNRFIEVEKSKIYANLFVACLNGKFDWNDLRNLAICLEKFHLAGLNFFHKVARGEGNGNTPYYIGDSQFETETTFLIAAGMARQWGTHFIVNTLGQYLYVYGIKGDINYTFPPNPNVNGESDAVATH
jgi:hypothetical protein